VEAEQLVIEYETSGMTRVEFCQKHGLALSTLERYRRRRQQEQSEGASPSQWVAVELSQPYHAGSGLAIVLSGGRRIEVGLGFDAKTLERLVSLLEPA
jgi:hypothetical protein